MALLVFSQDSLEDIFLKFLVSQTIQFAKSLLHVLGCFQLEKQNEAKFESGLNNKGFVILHNITSESGRFHNVLIQPVNALLKIQGS